MGRLNPEVKEQLLKAIDLAEGYGQCQYLIADEPACVVAQYLAQRDCTLEDLKALHTANVYVAATGTVISVGFDRGPTPRRVLEAIWALGEGGRDLLYRLQVQWDQTIDLSCRAVNEETARLSMVALVELFDRS